MPGLTRPILAAALLAVAGCAQTGKASPFAKFGAPESAAKVAEVEKKETAEKPKDAAAPKADADAKVAATDAKKDDAAEKKEAVVPPAKPTPGKATVHDAATLALIEEELKLVSADERARLYQEWKELDGPMVRQVIRIRRMVRDPGSVVAATGAGPAGLAGTADPWGGARPAALSAGGGSLALGAPIPYSEDVAGAMPTVQPAGHSVPIRTAAGHSAYGPTPGHSLAGYPAAGIEAPRTSPTIELLAGVQANGPPAAPAAEPVASASVPSPSVGTLPGAATADPEWRDALARMIASAERRAEQVRLSVAGVAAPPEDARRRHVEAQVHLRTLYLLDGQQARAMQAIPDLPPADQEFWQQVFWGLANYLDDRTLPNRGDRVAQTVRQLRTAITKLQGEANLELRNVAFCHKITSFGNYERFERDEYAPGQRVLLYAEAANFKSVPQPADGLYRTQLKSTIEVYQAGAGQPHAKFDFRETVDLCRSYRTDYFHSYELKIPGDLPLGPHVLKLTVEDTQSGKVAVYAVNFTVK